MKEKEKILKKSFSDILWRERVDIKYKNFIHIFSGDYLKVLIRIIEIDSVHFFLSRIDLEKFPESSLEKVDQVLNEILLFSRSIKENRWKNIRLLIYFSKTI